MTYHQYKLIKKVMRSLSLFCGLILLIGVGSLARVSTSRADDSCGPGNITLEPLDSIVTEISPGDSYHYRIKNNSTMATVDYGATYNYFIYVKDLKTSKEYLKDQGSFHGSRDLILNFDSDGGKEIRADYRLDGSSCENKNTNKLTINVVDRTHNSPYITFEVNSFKALIGDKVNIKTAITHLNGGSAMMTINDSPKWQEDITSDNFSHDFTWDTSGSSTGMHVIKLKVFDITDSTGNHPMTDMREININLCPKGSNIDNCASGNGDSTGGTDGSGSTTPVDVASGTSINFAGTMLDFTLNRGSGIGGFAALIVNLLLALIGALSFISFLIAGIQYILANGDSGKTDKAKKTIYYSITAILLVSFSYTIIYLVNYYANH